MHKKTYTSLNKAIIVFSAAIVSSLFNTCTKDESAIDLKQDVISIRYIDSDILEIPMIDNSGDNQLKSIIAAGHTKSVVVPIILVPKGSIGDSVQLMQVYQALENLRFWFKRELPDKDIRWDNVKILYGQQTAEHYRSGLNVWNEIPNEIEAEFGWNPWKTGAKNHIALVMGKDLYGWAGGNGIADGRGLAILGLESLVDLTKVNDQWWGTQEFWHGTAIHELGHALTLGHSDDPASIMCFHGDFKSKHLSSDEKVRVQSNPVCQENKGPMPIARWTFDERTLGYVVDESGNDNTLTMEWGALYEAGLIEGAALFDGIDAIAKTEINKCNVSTGITISAWVKPYMFQGYQTIVNKGYAPDAYGILIYDDQYEFFIAFPGVPRDVVYYIRTKAILNKWTHLVACFDGKNIYLGVNGKVLVSKEAVGSIQQSNIPVCIGNHPDWNSYNGLIDKVEIYNQALSKNEILTY